MSELADLISAFAALINKFGIWVVLAGVGVGVFIWRFDKIWSGVGAVLERLFPVWAETRKLRIERKKRELEQISLREQAEWEHEQLERKARLEKELDTTIILKDMLLAYKTELDNANLERKQNASDAKLERSQFVNRVYSIAEGYERLMAQSERTGARTVEALRDVSSLLQSQTKRLDQVCRIVEEKRASS